MKLSIVIALWLDGLLFDEDVINWADSQLLLDDVKEFDNLMEFSLNGPKKFINSSHYHSIQIVEFSYLEKLSLRLSKLNITSESHVNGFINWLIRACIGEPIEIEEVSFGYLVDHYFCDCDDRAFAVEYFNKGYNTFLPKSREIADTILARIV